VGKRHTLARGNSHHQRHVRERRGYALIER
jgi:hypothetical protein